MKSAMALIRYAILLIVQFLSTAVLLTLIIRLLGRIFGWLSESFKETLFKTIKAAILIAIFNKLSFMLLGTFLGGSIILFLILPVLVNLLVIKMIFDLDLLELVIASIALLVIDNISSSIISPFVLRLFPH